MSIASFPELLLSLSIQAGLLIMVARWLAAREVASREVDRIWRSCHFLILVLCGLGLLLPHMRLLPRPLWPTKLVPLSMDSSLTVAHLIFMVWCVGAVVMLLAVVISFVRATAFVAGSLPGDEISETGECSILPDVHPVQIRISPLLVSPICWQFHRPYLVLPEAVLDFPEQEVASMIRHELAHLQLNHPFWLFLQRLVEIIFWFHPLVWNASARAEVARELVCDFNACRGPADAAQLLRGLHRLAAYCTAANRISAALPFWGAPRVLSARVSQLLAINEVGQSGSQRRHHHSVGLFAAALLVTFCWLPFSPTASDRSLFSPWPRLSATVLSEVGLAVRDYEIDAFCILERQRAEEKRRVTADSR